MALSHILQLIAANGGVTLSNQEQLIYTTAQVNQAWKEIYEQNDVVGSLREEIYNVRVPEGNLVSLEPYVGQLRAVRYYYPQLNLKVRTMAPRYKAKFWQVKDFLSWEMKGDKPLKRDISNDGTLTFTFLQPLSVACNITIVGATELASQIIETIAFAIGDNQKISLNSFNEITNISIDIPRNCDCIVSDIDGRELARIQNNQRHSLYQWLQIVNLPNNQWGNSQNFVPATTYVETLWKLRWKPFVNNQDECINPAYDEAIFWKYMENRALLDSSQNIFSANQAEKFANKCNKILKDIAQDASQTAEMSLNFGENATIEAFTYITHNRTGFNYPYGMGEIGYDGIVWP